MKKNENVNKNSASNLGKYQVSFAVGDKEIKGILRQLLLDRIENKD